MILNWRLGFWYKQDDATGHCSNYPLFLTSWQNQGVPPPHPVRRDDTAVLEQALEQVLEQELDQMLEQVLEQVLKSVLHQVLEQVWNIAPCFDLISSWLPSLNIENEPIRKKQSNFISKSEKTREVAELVQKLSTNVQSQEASNHIDIELYLCIKLKMHATNWKRVGGVKMCPDLTSVHRRCLNK